MKNHKTVTLRNLNATDVEKKLYSVCGLYLVEEEEWTLTYAPVHNNNEQPFPYEMDDIEEELIEYQARVIFDKMSETINISSSAYYDIDIMTMLVQRMEELGFK